MKNAVITPSQLKGEVTMPPSKSAAHRAVLCAALSGGECTVSPIELSEDLRATVLCARALGVDVDLDEDVLYLNGKHLFSDKIGYFDCLESGSTLRFFVPIAAAGGIQARFVGRGKLPERPIGTYLDCLPKHGVACESEGGLPLDISGQLTAGDYVLPGNISSQFITGLLFALPLLSGDSTITLTTPLESKGYVNLTLQMLSDFGVNIEKTDTGYAVKGSQHYVARNYSVEGDWSQAAFFLAAAAFGGEITLQGLRSDSTQGDRAALALFRGFGMRSESLPDGEIHCRAGALCAQDIDAAQIPDLVPMLAVTAALCKGVSRIYHAERLRIKESDRLKSTASLINALGGRCEEIEDGLLITGVDHFTGGVVDGCNDHRIVMAAAMAALKADGPVTILGADAVKKSYPSFFTEYNRLGGNAHVVDVG